MGVVPLISVRGFLGNKRPGMPQISSYATDTRNIIYQRNFLYILVTTELANLCTVYRHILIGLLQEILD